jgi:hypothetical protein
MDHDVAETDAETDEDLTKHCFASSRVHRVLHPHRLYSRMARRRAASTGPEGAMCTRVAGTARLAVDVPSHIFPKALVY